MEGIPGRENALVVRVQPDGTHETVATDLGVACGLFFPEPLARVFLTFNGLFSAFLGFIVPLLIVGAWHAAARDCWPLLAVGAGFGCRPGATEEEIDEMVTLFSRALRRATDRVGAPR